VTYRIALPLVLAIALFVFTAAAVGMPNRTNRTVATIATVSSSDFRAELVARRASSGRAPTATATVTAYRHTGHGWQRLVSKRLPGTFFWNTLVGPRSICRFELASAGRAHIAVELLQSPALGCAQGETVSLER
jgi:hypothetical protein